MRDYKWSILLESKLYYTTLHCALGTLERNISLPSILYFIRENKLPSTSKATEVQRRIGIT